MPNLKKENKNMPPMELTAGALSLQIRNAYLFYLFGYYCAVNDKAQGAGLYWNMLSQRSVKNIEYFYDTIKRYCQDWSKPIPVTLKEFAYLLR